MMSRRHVQLAFAVVRRYIYRRMNACLPAPPEDPEAFQRFYFANRVPLDASNPQHRLFGTLGTIVFGFVMASLLAQAAAERPAFTSMMIRGRSAGQGP
ncbi:unnamed protein product [Vitrella brassicaformis CCMP3155]|uniref:Uncharacterized protein n=2 Tax=Vitrella brassicaformis TaxID=1169539 RepID=A0A0G4EWZ9_VITBC|nr:unnamed protein product [Vitrella brassicaformis CCMP3155]|eukprot:CEM03181.1 unnamed protein product [Vitrella brassicaformis CCMP3155]